MTTEEIKNMYEADGDAPQAIGRYTLIIDDAEASAAERESALIERGLLHWKLGHRAECINDYNTAIRLNPQSRAQQLRATVYEILDFYHRDLYNP